MTDHCGHPPIAPSMGDDGDESTSMLLQEPSKKQTFRRRSRRACLSCRARKVRCDVVVQGIPCGNCKWDDAQCVVLNRRRNRYYHGTPTAPEIASKSDASTKAPSPPTQATIELLGTGRTPQFVQGSDGTSPRIFAPQNSPIYETGEPLANATTPGSPGVLNLLSTRHSSIENTFNTASGIPPTPTSSGWSNEMIFGQALTGTEKSPPFSIPTENTPSKLPLFIAPLSTQIPAEDLAYLSAKGALKLPDKALQTAILRSYFDYVHPFMPILDLERFLQSVSVQEGEHGKTSLLLFQAIMFAGSAHVDMDHLRKAGFRTRRQARKTFFQRTRLIYDFNCEPDRFIIVQSLLLMSLWYETAEDHRNAWHWIDVAISQAFAACLHLEATPTMDPSQAQLRRRVWWACLIRDRLISMAMRRPPRIRDIDISVSMLQESDFSPDSSNVPEAWTAICSYANQPARRHHLALLCVAMAQLCRSLRYQVPNYFSIFEEKSIGDAVRGSVGPNEFILREKETEVASCHEDLLAWYSKLPSHCRHRPTGSVTDAGDESIAIHCAVLHMVFYTALAGLYHARYISLMRDGPGRYLFECEMAKIRMQHAAAQISDIAGDLSDAGLDRLLPSAGVTFVVTAAVAHLLIVKQRGSGDRAKALNGYRRCMRALQNLQDMYGAADVARDAMEWAFLDETPSLVGDVSTATPISGAEASPRQRVGSTFSTSEELIGSEHTFLEPTLNVAGGVGKPEGKNLQSQSFLLDGSQPDHDEWYQNNMHGFDSLEDAITVL